MKTIYPIIIAELKKKLNFLEVGVLDCLLFSRIPLRPLNARIELRGNWTLLLLSFAFQTRRLLSAAHVSNNRPANSSFDAERQQRLCVTMFLRDKYLQHNYFSEGHCLAVAVIQLTTPLRPEALEGFPRARVAKPKIIKSAKGGETCALNSPPTKIIGRISSRAKRQG